MARFGPPNKMMGLNKEKFDFSAIKKLIKYCKQYLPTIIISLFLAVVGAVATIIGPRKLSEIGDKIYEGVVEINGVDITSFIRVCIFLILLYAVGAVANYVQQFLMAGVTQKTSKRL